MRKTALAMAVSTAAVLMLPASAIADGVPPINIGPITVHHGYQLTIQAGCGKYAYVSLYYLKTTKGVTESHTVNGSAKPKTCKLAGNLSSAQLDVDLGKAGSIHVTIKHRGKASREKPFVGCTGKGPLVQPATVSGAIDVSFAKRFFGSVHKGSESGWLEQVPNEKCKPPAGENKVITLYSGFGASNSTFVSTNQPVKGPRSVFIFTQGSVNGLPVTHSLNFTGGRSLFNAPASLDTAKVGAVGPWTTGSLTFHGKAGCAGRSSRTGTLTGTLIAHFDVVGNVALSGAQAVGPMLSRGFSGQPC